MYVISATNVRDALPKAIRYLTTFGRKENTRIGEATVATRPITIHYYLPKQHVLVNSIRDANPFFHLMEAMWMLAGRRDGAYLDYYVKDFSKNFGVDGVIEDAYGHRWKYALEYDQLEEIIMQLKKNPESRQCVLQMWGAGRADLLAQSARPCNLVATFRISSNKLDMTVFNRSNDVIWGACGANAVHFAILQEYIAGMIGVKQGEYWQISTNLHLYQFHINMLQKRIGDHQGRMLNHYLKDAGGYEKTLPLIDKPISFNADLEDTMSCIDDFHANREAYTGNIANTFLRDVVIPMARAHQKYRNKDLKGAILDVNDVVADDWRKAGREWLQRRMK